MSNVRLGIQGGEQFKELSKKLKAVGEGKELQTRLRRGIRDAAGPAERDLKAAVMRVRVQSDKGGKVRPDRSTGLRARTARAIRTTVTQRGVRVIVDAKKVGPYGASLPRYLDGTIGVYRRWRHPVFGNTDVWTEQSGSAWFFVTMQRRAPAFQREVLKAMDAIERELTS